MAVPCDITDYEQIGEMIREIKREVGSVDVLINNAASKGYESESRVSESFLTRKTDKAAQKNLEIQCCGKGRLT